MRFLFFLPSYAIKTVIVCIAFAFSANAQVSSTGTGFFISSDGHLATNYHVIEGGKSFAIRNNYGEIIPARVIRTDTRNDLVILKAEGKNFVSLPIARSSEIKKGESVFTIGFPNIGMQGLEAKVTQGIISSLSGVGGSPNTFQISAAVQPGNSGGPLLNEQGQVIGVVNAKLSAFATLQQGAGLPENVNYAIKSNYLLELISVIPGLNINPQPRKQENPSLPTILAKVEPGVVLVISYSTVGDQQPAPPPSKKEVMPPPRSPPPSPDQRSPITIKKPLWQLAQRCAKTFASYNNDYTAALRTIKPLAQKGQLLAQACLGRMYADGHGVEKNDVEAVRWFRLAAEQGGARAQNNLGSMYANGRGVEKNDEEAIRWFRLAAKQNYATAQCNLGSMYANGHGVEKDDTEAVRWYRLAAEQNDAMAQTNLGFMYSNGQGVEKNETEAVRWFRLAAQSTDMEIRNIALNALKKLNVVP